MTVSPIAFFKVYFDLSHDGNSNGLLEMTKWRTRKGESITEKSEKEGQHFIPSLMVTSLIYNKDIYLSGKYIKQAFISYINKHVSDG